MKFPSLILLPIFMVVIARAQQAPVLVIQEAGKLSLAHEVAPKENWYSIGRLYNVSPRELTVYNKATMTDVLEPGQPLRIPLTASNFAQSGQPASDEAFVPLHHVVREKEGLFRIGQDHGKVSPELLRTWNSIPGDAIQPGMNLVVGFLRVKKSQSALAAAAQPMPLPAAVPRQEEKPVANRQPPPPDKKETAARPEEKKASEPPPAARPAEARPQPARNVPEPAGAADSPGGYFRNLYESQTAAGAASSLVGNVSSFKSTSGWKDARYYALMNDVMPGTVVKFIHPATGNFVYAKVLGELPLIRENEGLVARLSNAAIAALSLEEGRYELRLGWTRQ